MGKYIIEIPVKTDIDPSTLLEIAQGLEAIIKEQVGEEEECEIDENEVSVTAVS